MDITLSRYSSGGGLQTSVLVHRDVYGTLPRALQTGIHMGTEDVVCVGHLCYGESLKRTERLG